MRVISLFMLFTLVAIGSASECQAQWRSTPSRGDPDEVRPFLLESARDGRSPAPSHTDLFQAPVGATSRAGGDRLQSWEWHIGHGMAVGGAAGLIWGIAEALNGDNVLGLSPVIETAIGAGTGFYVGTAVYLIRRLHC
jgi:hypothetical protein